MPRHPVLALFLLATLAGGAEAQRVPRRPRLAADADTNDAIVYFQLGLARVERNADEAAAAFYWAGRLDPASPQALYAQSVALLLADPQRLVRWVHRDERTLRSPAILAIDSLRFRAEMQDPFLHRGMEEALLVSYSKNAVRQDAFVTRSTSAGTSGLAAATEQYFEQEDPALRGLLYYSRNLLRDAQQYWTIALRARDVDNVWADRARAFYEVRQADSALAGYQNALRFSRRAEADPHHVYESRAVWQYAIGRILEDRRNLEGAREAYERAFAEDEGYYPAMLRLGLVALQTGDTVGAIGALARATTGPNVQFFALTSAATVLSHLQRTDRSVPILRRATDVEPYAATGWLLLGRELVNARDTTGAIAAFEKYLAIAPRNDLSRASTTQALAALRH